MQNQLIEAEMKQALSKMPFVRPLCFSRSAGWVTKPAIENYIGNHEYPAMQSDPKKRLLFS
jgi:hypothetical protein